MSETYHRLPTYLKQYCVEQDYDAYTARDHAAWRYIMRQNRDYFRTHAVPIYEKGLQKTGIPIDRIPRISEMDEKLGQFGWGAVAVNGFIPPAAFLEFQALGVLPIACDMRTAEHIEYTPAPDIVHEAAGHAPIIADPAYAAYLRRYARMAQQAIFSREDIDLYEAIRYLSDIKENPDTDPADIARAEARFQTAYESVSYVSEAAKVGRMAWWTVEYGLIGPVARPLIYGAGLLSSVGESQNCLSPDVRKIPLSVDCVEQGYDITKPQPQLFVAKDMEHLSTVLEDLERTMAFTIGGKLGLERARDSQMINTVVLDSGIEIAGVVTEFFLSADGRLDFLKFSGPVQLAYNGRQLRGHGRSRHTQGFSSPLGRFHDLANVAPHLISDADLAKLGVARGRVAKVEFGSGFQVEGVVAGWHREGDKLVYMTFRRATVKRGDTVYFKPEWGEFDLAIGEKAVSVHGGPANRDDFGSYDVGAASTKPGRSSPYSDTEIALFSLYQDLRELRAKDAASTETKASQLAKLEKIANRLADGYKREWLAALEVVEMARQKFGLGEKSPLWLSRLEEAVLDSSSRADAKVGALIRKGLELADQ